LVPGGTFLSGNDPKRPATVSPFRLDLFEVTVGRFRAFVQEYDTFRPKPGEGGHPKHPESGWDSSWETLWAYAPSSQELKRNMQCALELCDPTYVTWTDEPGANEYLPIVGITRHEAFAFCLWDGGRLPSEIEWNFARVGGEEQRPFPWGAEEEAERAVLVGTKDGWKQPVGSRPAGKGRWGHHDLMGSRFEFLMDSCEPRNDVGCIPYEEMAWPDPCVDCIVSPNNAKKEAAVGGESFYQKLKPTSKSRFESYPPTYRSVALGFRCARD
jgi:formylglycine-generating enzyme required for sulfatase activity